MLSTDILNNNLNDIVPYKDFFNALGYMSTDNIYLRAFKDKDKGKDKGQKMQIGLWNFQSIVQNLRELNEENYGIYYVVNGGGQNTAQVKVGRAFFAEYDDAGFEEQIRLLNKFPYVPSIIIRTAKSMHCYWIVENGERDILEWRFIQNRLIKFFHSDATIEDPPRVMRLYGFEHRKADPIMVRLIKFNPELKYTTEQFSAVLPELSEMEIADIRTKQENALRRRSKASTVQQTERTLSDRIPHGKRHKYVVKRLGYYVARLPDASDTVVLQAVYTDFLENCEQIPEDSYEEFRSRYLGTIRGYLSDMKNRKRDPDHYRRALKAWKRANPGKDWEESGSPWIEAEAALLNEQSTRGKDADDAEKTLEPEDAADPDYFSGGITENEAKMISNESQITLRRTEKGQTKSCFDNYVKILQHDNYLSGKIKFNSLSGRPELSDVFWDLQPHLIRDEDIYNVRLLVSYTYEIQNKDDIRQAIEVVARQHIYHPVQDKLNGLKWDGTSRISELFPRYLGAERSEYTTEVTRLLLHGAIRRVFEPGVKFDTCLILADTKQGTGKSSMCRLMALEDQWFCDTLGNLSDQRQSFEMMQGHWIIELPEMLAIKRAADVETIKAFITRQTEGYRTPYGVYREDYPRQCIFIGTTNRPQFLPNDKTGNRRFVPLICDGDKADRHPLDDVEETRRFIEQCYAEAMVIGERSGWGLTLDRRFYEYLNDIQEEGSPDDTREGLIQEWLDNTEHNIVCSRLIYDIAFGRLGSEPSRFELEDIADIMNLKIRGWERYKGKDGKTKDAKYRFGSKWCRTMNKLFDSNIIRDYGLQRAWVRSGNETDKKPGTDEFVDFPENDIVPFKDSDKSS